MAFNKLLSILGGGFDCTMRDRSEGLCAGIRTKGVPEPAQRSAVRIAAVPDPNRHCAFPEGMNHEFHPMASPYDPPAQLCPVASPYDDPAETLHRLPSPGLSLQSLPSPSHSLPSRRSNDNEYMELRALFLYPGGRQSKKGHSSQIQTSDGITLGVHQEDGFPAELPADFFQKLAALVAGDKEVQRRMVTGDMAVGCGFSVQSRFLQQCIKDNMQTASQLWTSLSYQEKSDMLLAYSCGPPTYNFFADILMPRRQFSDCATSVDSARSDATFYSRY